MQICVVGSGYVGLVTGACLADSGNHVVAVDADRQKVVSLSRGDCPFFEPGLQELLRTNLASGRLRFTTDMAQGVAGTPVIFIAVGTPPNKDGSANLSAIDAVAEGIAQALTGKAIIITKSTVPVGTGARLERLIAAKTSHPFTVVSNPEFLKEGAAVEDFFRPDRVVIGTDDPQAREIISELYQPFVRNNKPILCMSRAAAELTKYAANAYLSTRISFINEVSELCERLGVNIDEVRRGIGTDARIGHHFLYPGVGYGGSCFPKDVQALANTGRKAGANCDLLDAVHRRNLAQRERMIRRIRDRLGPDLSDKRVAVWGIAFKPNTDDIREAPAVATITALLDAGVQVAAHDPRALDNARALFGERASYHHDAYAALEGADALILMTEWNEYRSPDFDRIRAALTQPLIFDGRNIYDPAMMTRYNFEYYSVGRPDLRPA